MKKSVSPAPIEVYYNSACPVCRAGIDAQKERSTACEIEWTDIHQYNAAVEDLDEELDTVRKYLHVTDGERRVHMGIHAFIVLWQQSPKEQWKAKLFSLPVVKQLSQVGYVLFANLLYAWNRLLRHW